MAACPTLLDRNVQTLDERTQSLCDYAGKVLLVVNTASQCGYTPQYDGLEALFRKYRDRGLVVLGFPMNDFGGQAPRWNFHKYLVDRRASRVQSFGTRVEPNDAKLVNAIERLLEEESQ